MKFAETVRKHYSVHNEIRDKLYEEGPEIIIRAKRNGYSIRKLAEAIGVSVSYISFVKNKKANISPEVYLKIADLLD